MRDLLGILATIALAALTPITISSCKLPLKPGGQMQSQNNVEADLRSIEALNQHDVNATLRMDIDAIISQWTDDFVVLQAAGPITRGRSANAAAAKQSVDQMKDFMPIEYNL